MDYERFNLHAIDRIEIVKGASSTLYGSRAARVVINLITKKTSKPLDINVGVRYGMMNERNYKHKDPQLDPVTGEVITRPEYLILPATFGMWMMIMVMYLFSTKNGCNFINWWQRLLLRDQKNMVAACPMTRHSSIVTFMELIMIMWGSYLLLMFCYDDVFLGVNHPVTIFVGVGCR